MSGEPTPVAAPADISDHALTLQFESLGDNCELGMVQRRVGAEPLGLFRFAGLSLANLLRAMAARFDGLADPALLRLHPAHGEYMVSPGKYELLYHTHAKIGVTDPHELHRQQARILPFLVERFLAELENPTKIMVFRQNEPLLASDLLDLRLALGRFGPATLLWVQEARPGHPPGSADRVEDRLLTGYVRRLADRRSVPDFDLPSWLAMLRAAYALSRPAADGTPDAPFASAPEPALAIRLRFGQDGNAGGCTETGWSPPEPGFTWAIEDRSLLILPALQDAAKYRLDMQVAPFEVPPLLPAQALGVVVNGETVEVFDPLARGQVGCTVPGRLVSGRDKVEIVLEHPRAASPQDVAGQNDVRRLAVAFERLSLSADPDS